MIHSLTFYFFAGLAIVSSLYVVLTRKPTYGVLALVITMFSLSGLFILLKAYFIAIIQILIYAGAILVLFLFILMLIGIEGTVERNKLAKTAGVVFLSSLFLVALLTFFTVNASSSSSNTLEVGTIEQIGRAIFHHHLFSFELISFVLLVGAIGIVSITSKENSNRP